MSKLESLVTHGNKTHSLHLQKSFKTGPEEQDDEGLSSLDQKGNSPHSPSKET